MKTITLHLPEIKLVGITSRTNNMLEMNPLTAKIGPTIHSYMQNNIPSKVLKRKNPNINFSVYTEYESDYTGNYTYFIGEEVEEFKELSSEVKAITIPKQKYIKFTTKKGPLPAVVIAAWMEIWTMSEQQLTGIRNYIADFEVYDERSNNPLDAEVDIYIGIK